MKKPKTITPRVSAELSKALGHELGYKRLAVDILACVSTIYTMTGARGLTLKDVRYLFLKYPNLLTWSDFNITKLEDLDQFIVNKEEYLKLLKIVVLGRTEKYEEA